MRKPLKISTIKSKIKRSKKISKIKRLKKYPVRKASEVTVSKGEIIFEKILKKEGINLKAQHKINYKFYDFIIEGTNILVEYDGCYWHCDPRQYPNGPEDNIQKKGILNDIYKNKLALANGYTLIRIWESDFKENPKKVAEKIKKIIKEQTEK